MDIASVDAPAVIIHGVNCQRTMKSGVAKALFTKWPQVKEAYMEVPKEDHILGRVGSIKIKENLFIINCWTQREYGYDGKGYASVKAIDACLWYASNFAIRSNIKNIYSPRIGCGLGGLDWETDVKPVFELVEHSSSIDITICDI